ncbi:MAG: nitrophenyl compound nitroreductase subunit ArsF family protein [Saprospiraceae bacterium]
MKNLIFLSLSFLFFSCQGQDNSKTIATDDTSTKIEVIDFYGTHRCVTCKAIEANAKYTVETYFQDAVQNGLLEFKTINVDDANNYGLAEKFEATGTALFINVIKAGQEQHIDLTNFAFKKGNDKEVFSNELKEKIEEQLSVL